MGNGGFFRNVISKTVIITLVFLFPFRAVAAEPEWWTQQKRKCNLSPGLAYNSWDGKCNSSSSTGGSSYGGGSLSPAQQLGATMAEGILKLLFGGGKDSDNARREEQARANEEARLAEQKRIAEERREAEEKRLAAVKLEEERKRAAERQAEEKRQRLLGGIIGIEASPKLTLMGMDSGQDPQAMAGDKAGRDLRRTEFYGGQAAASDAMSSKGMAGVGFDDRGKDAGGIVYPGKAERTSAPSVQIPEIQGNLAWYKHTEKLIKETEGKISAVKEQQKKGGDDPVLSAHLATLEHQKELYEIDRGVAKEGIDTKLKKLDLGFVFDEKTASVVDTPVIRQSSAENR